MDFTTPRIAPLGDGALTVAFSDTLTLAANRRAIGAARAIGSAAIAGVTEVVPNLVSVFVGYDPEKIAFVRLSGEIGLALAAHPSDKAPPRHIEIATQYGGSDGPDLDAVAALLGVSGRAFVRRHAMARLQVLATGFAPGFVYCGIHGPDLVMPRRRDIRRVPAGSVLFAAGQTALCATDVPTGWHVIGRTRFVNFDPVADPPVTLTAGDTVTFTDAAR